jgi:hypothetical protein
MQQNRETTMNSADKVTDCLTIEQIKARYPSEWVVIDDPVLDDALEVLSGKVISHGLDRNAVYAAAKSSQPRDLACLYLGELPTDLIFAL